MTNIIRNLLNNTFAVNGNIGNTIEVLCGAKVSTTNKADLGFWEIKSRKYGSVSPVSLGGKSTNDIQLVIEQVYSKVQNVILVEYKVNDTFSFTVNGIVLMWNLDKKLFYNGLGKIYHAELHHGACVLRCSEKNFIRMYGRRVIRYG